MSNLADDLFIFRICGVPQGSILGLIRISLRIWVYMDQKVLDSVLNFQSQLRTQPFLLKACVRCFSCVCLTYQPLEVEVDGGVS